MSTKVENIEQIKELKDEKQSLQKELDRLRKRRGVLKDKMDSGSGNLSPLMNEFIATNKKLSNIREKISIINKKLTTNETYRSWVYGYFKI